MSKLTSLVHKITSAIDEVAITVISDFHSTLNFHRSACRGSLLHSGRRCLLLLLLLRLLSTRSSSPTATPDGLQRFVSSAGLCRRACAAVQTGALHSGGTASIRRLSDTHSKHFGRSLCRIKSQVFKK